MGETRLKLWENTVLTFYNALPFPFTERKFLYKTPTKIDKMKIR